MIRLDNEPMANHTTFRLGGPADIFLIPENEDELIEVFTKSLHNKESFKILGNGSNILVSDNGVRGVVVDGTKSCLRLEFENGLIYAGASVKVQKFIRFCTNNNLQAPEYLFSVPATIGGCVYMNAGRGKTYNQQISDFLESVRVYDGVKKEIFILKREQCQFQYRSSIFHEHKEWLILGAYFKSHFQEQSIGDQKIKERMQFVKNSQDYNYPTVGSIFKEGNYKIFELVKGLAFGGAQYSKKTTNWINNVNHAKSKDVLKLISTVELLHFLTLKKIIREVEVWK